MSTAFSFLADSLFTNYAEAGTTAEPVHVARSRAAHPFPAGRPAEGVRRRRWRRKRRRLVIRNLFTAAILADDNRVNTGVPGGTYQSSVLFRSNRV